MKFPYRSFALTVCFAQGLLAQTAPALVGEGKAYLGERALGAASEAFEAALALDPALEEAHLYAGLTELLGLFESPEMVALLHAFGARLELDWIHGRYDFDWLALDGPAPTENASAWRYATDPSAADGDAIRSSAAPSASHGDIESALSLGVIEGPGKIHFRARAEAPPGTRAFLKVHAKEFVSEKFTELEFKELSTEWEDYSFHLPAGEQIVYWSRSLDPVYGNPAVSFWLDHIRFAPDGSTVSSEVVTGDGQATLANGGDTEAYHFRAQIEADSHLAESSFIDADFNTRDAFEFLSGAAIDRFQSVIAHWSAIESTDFASEFVYYPPKGDTVIIDRGDLQLLCSFLEGFTFVLQTTTSLNAEAHLQTIVDLVATSALESIQAVLTIFPDLLQTVRPAQRVAAEQTLRRAHARYLEAIDHLNARAPGTRRLFNLDRTTPRDEEVFRDAFTEVVDGLDTPAEIDEDILASGNFKVDLSALFDPTTDWRTLLPFFSRNSPLASTAPDPTFNGLFPDADDLWLDSALREADWLVNQPKTFQEGTIAVSGLGLANEPQFHRVSVEAIDETAQSVILKTVEDAVIAYHLWDRAADTFRRIDLATDGRPIDAIDAVALSGDGNWLFMASADALLAGDEPSQERLVTLAAPLFKAPFSEPEERLFTLDGIAQSYGGTRPSRVSLALRDPESPARGTDYLFGQFELETPTGEVYRQAFYYFPDVSGPTQELVVDLPPSADTALNGNWKLRLILSETPAGEEAIYVDQIRLEYDVGPVGLFRRAREGDSWEPILQGTTGERPNQTTLRTLVVSRTGERVAFVSDASNLVPETIGANTRRHAYALDVPTGTTRLLSATTESGFDYHASATSLSADGTRVSFETTAPLVAGDINGLRDIYLFDFATDELSVVSVSSSGLAMSAASGATATQGTLSSDGTELIFQSNSTTLWSDTESPERQDLALFVKDLQSGTLQRVSEGSSNFFDGATLTPDGLSAYFTVFNFNTNEQALFVIDRQTREATELLSSSISQKPKAAPVAGIVALDDGRGNFYFHDAATGALQAYHLQPGDASYVAMEAAGLVFDGLSTAVSIPVRYHPAANAPATAIKAHFSTTGGSALPLWHYAERDLGPLELTLENPIASLEIPLLSQAFEASLGVFTLHLESIEGAAKIGHPNHTVVVLERLAAEANYAAWRKITFPDPIDQLDDSISGPYADPDEDGRANLVELALASDPRQRDRAAALGMGAGRRSFEFTFNQNAGVRFSIESSSDLWRWHSHPLQELSILEAEEIAPGVQRLRIQVPGARNPFHRIRIEP